MAKFETISYYNRPEFLASEDISAFTYQADKTGDYVKVENGRKIAKAGKLFPSDTASAIGIIMQDVDVTDSPQPIAVLRDGAVYFGRLETALAVADLQKAMPQIIFVQ